MTRLFAACLVTVALVVPPAADQMDSRLRGAEIEEGDLLWKHDWPMGGGGSRVVQPVILEGGDILVGTSFGLGTRRIAVSSDESGAWSVDEGWTSRGLKPTSTG